MSNFSLTSNSTSFSKKNVEIQILASVGTAVCVLGVIGNVLCAVVLRRMANKTVRLLEYLSYVDIANLVLLFFSSLLQYVTIHDIGIVYRLFYPFSFIFGVTVYTFEIYLTVLIAIQRCFATAVPLKFNRYSSNALMNKALVSVAIFSILFNVPHWIAYNPKPYWNSKYNMFLFKEGDKTIHEKYIYKWIYNGYITLAIRCIVPMATLVACNVSLVVSGRKKSHERVQLRTRDGGERLTIIVIVITVISVITHVFSAVVHVVTFKAERHYLNTSLAIVIAVNSSVNFILWCSLGKKFRKTFMSMFRKHVYHVASST